MTSALGLRAASAETTASTPVIAVPAVWAAAAGLLVLLPNFSASPFADDYDSQRLLELAVCTLLVAGVTAVPRVRASWLAVWACVPSWAATCVAGIGALGMASASLAPRPVYAFAEVALFAAMGVGVVAVASAGRSRAGLGLVAVAALGGYAAFVLPLHLADLARGVPDVWPAQHLGFGNVRQVNHLQVWLLPLVWALAASTSGWRRTGLRAIGVATAALMVATNGRGVLVALSVGLVVAGVTVRSGRRAMLREALVSAGLGVGLWALLFAGGVTALNKNAAATLNGRGELWAGALRMIADHPWLGVGPMHFVYAPTRVGAHPHNLVLQLASEWGVPAALAAVALALGAGAGWLRHARQAADSPWTAGLTAAFAGALVYALVDGFLIAPVSQMLAVLVLGALLAEALPDGRRTPAARASWRDLALAGVALPALAVLLGVAASDAPTLARRDYDLRAAQVSAHSLPRFWSTGQIAGRLPPEQARRWPAEVASR